MILKVNQTSLKLNLFTSINLFLLTIGVFFNNSTILAAPTARHFGINEVLRINPAFKIKRLSTGIVIASSDLENGKSIKHEFKDIYADILLAAIRKQSIKQIIPILARKYYYDEDECRRKIKRAVHDLQEWDILVCKRKIL